MVVRGRGRLPALELAVPLLLGAAVLGALWTAGREANPGPLGFPLDDAWIHMVYGRGLLNHGYLAYNDGLPSTGCTSPLWAVCLAAMHAVAGRTASTTVGAVVLLGALVQLLGIAAAAALALRLTGSRAAAGLAGSLLALATPFAAAAFTGMEVVLTGTLLVLAVGRTAEGAWGKAGVMLALAGLARPESAAIALVLAALLPLLVGGGGRGRALAGLLVPSIVAGLFLAAHHLWASGSPLPATFHAKSQTSLAALPARLAVALRDMLPGIPPFGAGLAWLALLGLVPWGRRAPGFPRTHLPLLAGATYLLANLLLIDPVDPAAFYHLRYLLPAVPLLLVALAVGAHAAGRRMPERLAVAPAAVLAALALVGAARTAVPVSHHLHNDVRNINEVQRRIGNWLGRTLPAGSWIASSDAGAVRYFSRLPTLDVLGLNTPEMLHSDEEFLRAHPVTAIVLLPAWFRPLDPAGLAVMFEASTDDYTVTSNPNMGRQIVLMAGGAGTAIEHPLRVRFVGYQSFAVDLAPVPREAIRY